MFHVPCFMVELIAFIILILSIAGIIVILFRKVPTLASLPQNGSVGLKKPQVIVRVQKRIQDTHFHFFEKQMLLHKILSFVKIWTLKIEIRIDALLHRIRKNAQQLDKENKKKK